MPASKQKQVGLLSEFNVYLVNADGSRRVGITRMIRQMTITEDIFKNTMYGSIRIKDAVNLLGGKDPKSSWYTKQLKGFPIVGEEFLEITYTTDFNDKTVNLRFAVYSISDILYRNNNTMKEYTLNFCSEEHLIDATTVVWKKYSKQHSDNIKDLCRDYLNLDDGSGTQSTATPATTTPPPKAPPANSAPTSNTTPAAPGTANSAPTDTNVGHEASTGVLGFPSTGSALSGDGPAFKNKKRLVTTQTTRGLQDIIIPRLSPIQACELIARRSIAEDGIFNSGTYLFFENFDGFHFCDVEYLIKRGLEKISKNGDDYTYFYESPLSAQAPERGKQAPKVDPKREFKTIHRADHIHFFDTIEKIKMGMFESDMIVYDYINHKTIPTRFRFTNNDNGDNNESLALGNIKGESYPENSTSFLKKVISEEDTSYKYTRKFFIPKDLSDPDKDTYLDFIYVNRASYFTRLAQDVFTIYTFGDPTINAGDVIKLNIPAGDGGDPKGASKINELLSGFWLVGTIRHIFTQTTYKTVMDVYKNSFGAPLLSTDEAVVNPPTAADNKDLLNQPDTNDLAELENASPADNTEANPDFLKNSGPNQWT